MNKIQTCKKNKQQQLQISKSSLLSSVSLEAVELQNVIYKYYLRIGVRVCLCVITAIWNSAVCCQNKMRNMPHLTDKR